jgi:hypothetical protein
MKNTNAVSFINQSQPPESPVTALEAYRAANPKVKEVQDALLAELHQRRMTHREGLSPLLHKFVHKAEQARMVGIAYLEFADTLAGKKLTRDFYEQAKPLFTDANGLLDSFEMVEWYMRQARHNPEVIDSIQTAIKWHQTQLLASGDAEFQLEVETVVKNRVIPKDELGKLQSWLENPELVEVWQKLKNNPNYFQDGHLRPSLRATMAEEFRPVIAVLDELKAELGL